MTGVEAALFVGAWSLFMLVGALLVDAKRNPGGNRGQNK